MEKGLIVSIQGYSYDTTQELSYFAYKGGAVGIRTDQPIRLNIDIIGLEKLRDKKYYITTSKEAIFKISRWGDFVAIDSRKGNIEIPFLYSICHISEMPVVADIETLEDIKNILDICKKKKIVNPAYFATTFSKKNIELIKEIKEYTNIPIIAEGGYVDVEDIKQAIKYGASNICIGAAISDIEKITREYRRCVHENI